MYPYGAMVFAMVGCVTLLLAASCACVHRTVELAQQGHSHAERAFWALLAILAAAIAVFVGLYVWLSILPRLA